MDGESFFALFILLIAGYFFYKAVRFWWRRWCFVRDAENIRAQVVQKNYEQLLSKNDFFNKKTLRFVNHKGEMITCQARWVGKGEKGQELRSDGVEIVYNPKTPKEIRLDSFYHLWFWPLFWLALMFLFLLSALKEVEQSRVMDDLVQPISHYLKLPKKI